MEIYEYMPLALLVLFVVFPRIKSSIRIESERRFF